MTESALEKPRSMAPEATAERIASPFCSGRHRGVDPGGFEVAEVVREIGYRGDFDRCDGEGNGLRRIRRTDRRRGRRQGDQSEAERERCADPPC